MKEKRDFIVIGLGNILHTLIVFASIRLMTFFLSPKEMGEYSLFYAFGTMFFSLFIVPASLYMQRKVLEWAEAGTLAAYTQKFLIYLSAVGILSGALAVLIKIVFDIALPFSNSTFFILVSAVTVFMNGNAFFFSTFNLFQMRFKYVIFSSLTALFIFIGGAVFVFSFGRNSFNWISGQVVGHLLMMALSGILFFRFISSKESRKGLWTWSRNKEDISGFLTFVFPVVAGSFVLWIQSESYRFFLGRLAGVEMLGLFSVGFTMANRVVEKFDTQFSNFYNPIFYKDIIANDSDEQKIKAWANYAQMYIPSILIAVLFVFSSASLLEKILIDPQYHGVSVETIRWGSVVMGLFSLLSLYRMIGIAKLKMEGILIPYILGAAVMTFSIVFLAPLAPVTGTGFSMAAGAFVSTFTLHIEMKKILPVRFPKKMLLKTSLFSVPLISYLMIDSCVPKDLISCLFFLIVLGGYTAFSIFYLTNNEISSRNLKNNADLIKVAQ
ncbi:MAG: hypothetical protein AB1650_07515 [Candidatus Omnitrophota bacterium]